MSETRDLAIFFEVMKLEHFADTFIEKGYTIDNLHLITESDLDKLRVTNKRERACLLGVVGMLKDEANLPPEEKAERRRARADKVRSFRRTLGPQEKKALARKKQLEAALESGVEPPPPNGGDGGGGLVMKVADDGNVELAVAGGEEPELPGFTATVGTANEHARQATIFLNHHRVDRPWPKAGSKLSQTLHLSGAAPVSYEPLYSIHVDGHSETVCPPHKHGQGYSAKFCKTCADFVSEAMQGAWQFQVVEKVLLGEGLYEEVPVWKPFTQTESMKIEYAHKRKEPSVKIQKAVVDFDASLWGTKPIRRVESDAVPFPTLKRKDLAPVPDKNVEPQMEMAKSIQDLQRTLVGETEERRSRLFIEQQEQKFLVQVLADIAAIIDEYHYQQRLALEAEETEARAKWEGAEYERALDKLYEWEEQSVRDVALRKWENESLRIMRGQMKLVEDMESVARRDVEAEEQAFRSNLNKLVLLFNEQVRECLDRARMKELRARRNQDGKPRCPVCRKFDCEFFCKPWKGQWKAHGGVLDLDPAPNRALKEETLSTLVNRANEKEYDDFLKNRKATRDERRRLKRMTEYLSNVSAAKILPGAPCIHDDSTFSAANGLLPPGAAPATAHHDALGVPLRSVTSPSPYSGESIDRNSSCDASPISPQDHGRPHSAMQHTRGGDTPADDRGRPRSAAGHSASNRSASNNSRASSLHGTAVFHNAVGSNRHVTPESVNSLTKQSRLRVARDLSLPVGSSRYGPRGDA